MQHLAKNSRLALKTKMWSVRAEFVSVMLVAGLLAVGAHRGEGKLHAFVLFSFIKYVCRNFGANVARRVVSKLKLNFALRLYVDYFAGLDLQSSMYM